jgi:hypothetical protein
MPHVNKIKSNSWFIGHEIRRSQFVKQRLIAPILAVTLILASSAWGGIGTNKDSTFGTQDDTVTVTVHGKLDMSGGKILALTPNTSIAMKELYSGTSPFGGSIIYGVSVTSALIDLDLNALRKNWHFFVATVNTEGVTLNGRTPEGNGSPTHTNSIMLPTAFLEEDNDYEMAKHAERYCLFRWLQQPVGRPVTRMQFSFDHVTAQTIKLYGVLKKN